MPELLLELLSEEIPARMQSRAIGDFSELIWKKLLAAELSPDGRRAYVTPRRLVVIVDGIAATQPDLTEERRGPRVGAPRPAVEGFLRSAGLAAIEECEIRDTGRGEFYFAVVRRSGRSAAEVLPELIRTAIGELSWPKSMRYPASPLRWVRPLNSVVCLLDGEVLPLQLGDVPVGRTTRGHRFLSDGEITVADAADYLARLEKAHVVLDQDRRKEIIAQGLNRRAAEHGLKVKQDEGLLEEVTGLVEYPVVLMGAIDADFVRPLPDGLPPEVLATAMRTHQKYFSCLNPDGTPAPHFLFVANNRPPDGGKTIIAGNERVLRARLADARFFWDQDRKIPLEDGVAALKSRVYHEKLGSMYDRAERMEKLAGFLADSVRWPPRPDRSQLVMPGLVPGIHVATASTDLGSTGVDGRDKPGHDEESKLKQVVFRAARLAKADLSTGMVGEFPELQGIMGRYYALNDNEDPRVADAVAQHYKPLGPSDTIPTSPEGIIVALADKIDALTAFFLIGERPSGSGDPFALRRAAQGVIRIILENELRLPLIACFVTAGASLGIEMSARLALAYELLGFVADRLKVHLRDKRVRHDLIGAIFGQIGAGAIPYSGTFEDDLVRACARVAALDQFVQSEDGANLLTAYRRASNIVRIEERRDQRPYGQEFDDALLDQPEEKSLATGLKVIGKQVMEFVRRERFDNAMASLARLRLPVDEFFDKVTVNTDEIAIVNGEKKSVRANRLSLLTRIRNTMNQVADFSQIEG